MSLPESLFPALGISAAAGLLSFLSPCVLPLVPAYLSYISGRGLKELGSGRGRGLLLSRSLAFVLGFSLVFAALGLAFAGGRGLASAGLSRALEIGAGLLVLLLGLNFLFGFARFLEREARFHPEPRREKGLKGLGGSFLLGLAFAAGWSPCVGPILASILFLAAREGSLGRAALLLGAYSAGLALPFLAAGLFLEKARPFLDWAKRRGLAIRIASGILLVALGSAMALGRLGSLSGAAARAGFALRGALDSGSPIPRLLGALLWLAAATAAALPALRGGKRWSWPRAAAAAAFVGLALCELLGLFSTAGIIAGWLLFAGP